MAELEVDLREATVALLRHLNIESGFWNLTVKLGFGPVTVENPEDKRPAPGALIVISKFGLRETPPPEFNVTTVDASDMTKEVGRPQT